MADSEQVASTSGAQNQSKISVEDSESDVYDSDKDPEYFPNDEECKLKVGSW